MKLNEIVKDIGTKKSGLLEEEVKLFIDNLKNLIIESYGLKHKNIQNLFEQAENMPLVIIKAIHRGIKSLTDTEVEEYNRSLNDLIMKAKGGEEASDALDTLTVIFMKPFDYIAKRIESAYNYQITKADIGDIELLKPYINNAVRTYDEERAGYGKGAKYHIERRMFGEMNYRAKKILKERGFKIPSEAKKGEAEEGIYRGGEEKAAVEKWRQEEIEKKETPTLKTKKGISRNELEEIRSEMYD